MILDTSTLGLIAFIVRMIGSVFFIIVLYTQAKLRFKSGDETLNGFRNLLILLTSVPLLFNFVATYNSLLRFSTGTQSDTVNSISFVLGAFASTATAIVLWMLYKKR